MALIKYSIGPITSVKDKDSVEEREDITPVMEETVLLLCKKCGLQHMIFKNEKRACCGAMIKTDELS